MFFYNINMLPSELFDKSINIRVGSQLLLILILILLYYE